MRPYLRSPAFLLCFLLSLLTLGAQGNPSFTNVTVHDPSVVRDGSTWYVFGSHMAAASTTDFLRWTQIASTQYSSSLIRNGAPQTEFAEALSYAKTSTFWAPDAIRLADGKYYYYYCACEGSSPLSALGLAVADSITGPYTNRGIMLRSGMNGMSPAGVNYNVNIHPNVVDPSVFFDATGKLWMVYGSFSGGIFILELDQTPGSATIGQPLPGQGYGKKLIGGNSSRIEGAYIIYSPETDYYYLFMTFGGLDAVGGYNIRIGRSRAPDGPYVDAAGNDLTPVKGNSAFDDATIAPYGVKLMGNWQYTRVAGEPGSSTTGYVSPGGCAVYRDPELGHYLMVFHTRFVGRGEQHEVRTHQLFLNEEGWFVAAPRRYAGEALARTDSGLIPGDYKLINHGKDITSSVKNSSVITLAANGSISGAATGSWSLAAPHYATLVFGDTSYRGVFAQVWDEDNQVWVPSFTALASSGVSVWGCKVAATTTNSAPAISMHPAAATVQAGGQALFAVSASGSPALSYQWRRNGVDIPGATGSSLTLTGVAAADAGAYSVVVSNSVASFQSKAARLEVTTPTAPAITTQPSSSLVVLNSQHTFSVAASGSGTLSYQWYLGDNAIPGATSATLVIPQVRLADLGSYRVVVSNTGGSVTSAAVLLLTSYNTPSSQTELLGLSSRARVGSGSEVLIPSFVTSGAGQCQLLVRAKGPGLASPEIPDFIAKPRMDLHKVGVEGAVAQNIGWDTGTAEATTALRNAFAQVGVPPFESGSGDSALLVNVQDWSAYSAVVSGADGKGGIALVEVYALGSGSPKVKGLACRAKAESGSGTLIVGVALKGTEPKQLLFRAGGPFLAKASDDEYLKKNHLKKLRLTLYGPNGEVLASNTGWNTAPNADEVRTATQTIGLTAYDEGSADSAILVTLTPTGYTGYTAHVSGIEGENGVALLEIYEAP